MLGLDKRCLCRCWAKKSVLTKGACVGVGRRGEGVDKKCLCRCWEERVLTKGVYVGVGRRGY